MAKYILNTISSGRIEFAQNLRGVAALFVVVYHILVCFWMHNADTQIYTGMPLYQGSVPFLSLILNKLQVVNFGALGVALFFLISGFVMPYALQKQSRMEFIVGRVFRIWPVYAAGLGVSLMALLIASHYFSIPFVPTKKSIVASLLISPNLFSVNSIDGVIWTLEIEIKFYLLIALFPFLTRGQLRAPVLFAILFSIFSTVFIHKPHHELIRRFLYVAENNMMFFTFMFMGSLFHFLMTQKIQLKQWMLGLTVLFILFLYQRHINLYQYPFSHEDLTAYIVALGLFSVFFFLQHKIRFPKIFDWLANISYPMYACHAVLGYVYLQIFCTLWPFPMLALISYFIILFLLSTWLHNFIELPSNKLGKRVAKISLRVPLVEQGDESLKRP